MRKDAIHVPADSHGLHRFTGGLLSLCRLPKEGPGKEPRFDHSIDHIQAGQPPQSDEGQDRQRCHEGHPRKQDATRRLPASQHGQHDQRDENGRR